MDQRVADKGSASLRRGSVRERWNAGPPENEGWTKIRVHNLEMEISEIAFEIYARVRGSNVPQVDRSER